MKSIKLFLGLLIFCIFAVVPLHSQTVKQDKIIGDCYQFNTEESQYEIDDKSIVSCSKSKTLGKIYIKGKGLKLDKKGDIPTYEINDGELFSLEYIYNNSLLTAPEKDWHLTEDTVKSINGIELKDDIKRGAVIFQTSPDGKQWTTIRTISDITQNVTFPDKKKVNSETDEINSIQLINGWYYRVIVAFKVEKKEKKDIPLPFIEGSGFYTPTSTYKKYAEVYKFRVEYKSLNIKNNREKKRPEKPVCYDPNNITKRTKDNKYQEEENIKDEEDPQYSAEAKLGKFCLIGFTDNERNNNDENNTYIKTVGDNIKLIFRPREGGIDINQLNGKKDLSLYNDKEGSDGDFQIKKHDMGRGELIIKHTDNNGDTKIISYKDYLAALISPRADTTVTLLEEGDYDIHLNYAIREQKNIFWGNTYYYRVSFSFKIKNGNSMFFILNAKTGSELSNKSITNDGFRIDTANNRSVKLRVERKVVNTKGNALDTRFKRSATNGEVFTEEGLYIISATLPNVDKNVKKICIGNEEKCTKYFNLVDN
jgi:hypothetical protein